MSNLLKNESTWLQSEIETPLACSACGKTELLPKYTGVEDWTFGNTAGSWSYKICSNCASLNLAPRPKEEFIGRAYTSYYTHGASDQNDSVATKTLKRNKPRKKLRDYFKQIYVRNRYLLGKETPMLTKIYFSWKPNKQLEIDQLYRHVPALQHYVNQGVSPRLLDVGCGDGIFLERMAELGWNVLGCDFDVKAVRGCKQKGLVVELGGLEKFDGEQELFEVITMSHVIEHVYQPLKMMQKAMRLLKPGGILWCETPNANSAIHQRYGSYWRGLEAPRHVIIFTTESLKTLVKNAGFEEVHPLQRLNPTEKILAASEEMANGRLPGKIYRVRSRALKKIAKQIDRTAFRCPEAKEFITLCAIKA